MTEVVNNKNALLEQSNLEMDFLKGQIAQANCELQLVNHQLANARKNLQSAEIDNRHQMYKD